MARHSEDHERITLPFDGATGRRRARSLVGADSATTGRAATDARGEATAARLIDATLACLARDGYANMSITTITAEAGLSRGALFHHFETKADLTASAAVAFFRARHARIETVAASIDPGACGLGERLDMLRREVGRQHVLYLEIVGALRTDDALRVRVNRAQLPSFTEEKALYSRLFPEADGDKDGGLIAAAVTFLQTLAADAPLKGDHGDLLYRSFRDMLVHRLTPAKCRGAPPSR